MTEFKPPKSLAKCADMLYETRQARLALGKQVEELQKKETLLKDHLIEHLPKGDASGISGKVARVSILLKAKPTVEDWDSFYAYVKKTGAFELLQRRLSETAVKERWDDDKVVPGVGKFNYVDVSLGKV